MSRFSELTRSTPLTTLFFMALCIGLFVLQALFDWPLHNFTMCPNLVIRRYEYYRMITSTLFHANLMHIGMNMMSTFAISAAIEKRVGTLHHMISIVYSIILTSTLYIAISYLASILFNYNHLMFQHAVGFSGIIFHMSVLECNTNPNQSRSLFGFTSVPAYLYPWVLLIVLQFIMPNLSFLGHLVGILTGTLESYGCFDCIFIKDSTMAEMESTWTCLERVVRLPNFTATPSSGNRLSSNTQEGLLQGVRAGAKMAGQWIGHFFGFIKVFIFGRGRQPGITLSQTSTPSQTAIPSGHVLGKNEDLRPLMSAVDGDEEQIVEVKDDKLESSYV